MILIVLLLIHTLDTIRIINYNQKLLFFPFPGDLEMPFCCQLWVPSPFTHPHMEAEAITYTHCKVKHQPSEQLGEERSDSL